jgi:site-specific recombinase XerD
MSEVKDRLLFALIHDFFKIYLPKQRQCSEHTISAYRDSLESLLDFVKQRKKIDLCQITFGMIDNKMFAAFLDSIEEKGNSVTTRNHRRDCIRAFYKYAAKMEPTAVIHYDEICKIPRKNSSKPDIISYMSEEAVTAILAQPDTTTEKGLRDQFLMILLYDTAARIQEMMDIRIHDIRIGVAPTVTLNGKGDKTRTIPLMKKTVLSYQRYLEVFHPNADMYSERPLFYTTRSDNIAKMHHDTARRFIKEYGEAASKDCRDVPVNVHPHLFRHTRAMHLYLRGMDMTLLSQWLGHVKLETTRKFYARADTEKKRIAIEKATDPNGPLSEHFKADRFIVTDDEIVKRLYGLR